MRYNISTGRCTHCRTHLQKFQEHGCAFHVCEVKPQQRSERSLLVADAVLVDALASHASGVFNDRLQRFKSYPCRIQTVW